LRLEGVKASLKELARERLQKEIDNEPNRRKKTAARFSG